MDKTEHTIRQRLGRTFFQFRIRHEGTDPSVSASRTALRNVSNGQPNTVGGWSAPADLQKTPTRGGLRSERSKPVSTDNFGQSVRRRLSRSHGDLSKLRPKSPPLSGLPGETNGLHLSPGRYVDDTQNAFSPNYSCHKRQNRQAIPRDWLPKQSALKPNDDFESVALPIHKHLKTSISTSTGGQEFSHLSTRSPPIFIQGLSPEIFGPLDFCIPVVRKYPASTNQRKDTGQRRTNGCPAVQNLDVTTVWNGLRYVEAQELYRIHQAFIVTLENMLASELWKIYQQRDGIPATGPDEDLYSTGVVRGISFCRDQLIEEMADSLYSSTEDMVRAQLGLIRLYLAASDCLIPYEKDSRDTSITVRVFHAYSAPMSYPVVTAAWVPDSIIFKQLNETPCEGQELSIIPQYQSKSAFGSTRSPANVRYSIESQNASLSWLVWHDDLAGFNGIVPTCSDGRDHNGQAGNTFDGHRSCQRPPRLTHKLCIDVKAVLVDDNGSLVRFERVVRARLTLEIIPWYASDHPFAASQNRPAGVYDSECHLRPNLTTLSLSRVTGSVQTQPYNSNVDVHPVEKDNQGHFNPVSLTVKPTIESMGMSDHPQKHADLAANHTDKAQRHTDAETHDRVLGSLTTFGNTDGHQIYSQKYFPGQYPHPPPAHRFHGERQAVGDDTQGALGFEHVSGRETIPPSPHLEARHQAPVVDRGANATFTTLPSPAIRMFPSQTFDMNAQAWNRIQPTDGLLGPRNQNPWLGGSHATQISHEEPSSRETEMLRMQAEALFGSPVRQNYSRDLVEVRQASITPRANHINRVAPKLKQSSRKRDAKSRPRGLTTKKRVKEEGEYNDTAPLAPDTIARSFTSLRYLKPCSDARSASLGEKSDLLSQKKAKISGQKISSGYHLDIHHLEGAGSAEHIGVYEPQPPQNTLTPRACPNEPVPNLDPAAIDETSKSSSLTQTNNPNLRAVSTQSCQTGNTFSRTPSSNLAFTVEDPQVVLSRSEQAQIWSQLPDAEESDKENQPKPPRLSNEEARALEKAVERSIDDLAGGFDSIFLDDSEASFADDGSVDS